MTILPSRLQEKNCLDDGKNPRVISKKNYSFLVWNKKKYTLTETQLGKNRTIRSTDTHKTVCRIRNFEYRHRKPDGTAKMEAVGNAVAQLVVPFYPIAVGPMWALVDIVYRFPRTFIYIYMYVGCAERAERTEQARSSF